MQFCYSNDLIPFNVILNHLLYILWFILQLIRNNIRGELTVAHTKEQFSLKDNSFIEAVASSLKISSSKVRLT